MQRCGAHWRSATPCLPLLSVALCAGCSLPETVRFHYEQQWVGIEGDWASGRTGVQLRSSLALIGSKWFTQLPEPLRHERLLQAAMLGEEMGEHAAAHRLYVRASELPEGGFEDWDGRLQTAAELSDARDVQYALTHIARHWPLALSGYSTAFIVEAASGAPPRTAAQTLGFELRLALYQAHFTTEYEVSPGQIWELLAGDLLERGRKAEAQEVIAAIDSPRILLSLRIDRRFEALLHQAPELFDIGAAARRQIERYERAVHRQPRSLDALARLSAAYLDAGRYADVVHAVGGPLGRLQDPDGFHAAYDDDDAALSALLGTYAQALMATQPWQDATGAMETATDALEHGPSSVRNALQLSWFYTHLGQPMQARRVLAGIMASGIKLTPRQWMQWHGARLAAAQGDPREVRESLAYLRAHQHDAVAIYQDALLRLGRSRDAARLLIARLRDPETCRAALLEVQTYREPSAPASVLRQRARWRALVSRPDVQRAIARVGHVETSDLPPPEP